MRNTFLLYIDRLEVLDEMTDADAGKLFKAIRDYVQNGSMPERGTVVSIAFRALKPALDSDTEKYRLMCLQRSEAGKKSGQARAKKNKNEQEQTEQTSVNFVERERTPVHFVERKATKRTDTDTNTDTDIYDEDDDNKRACACVEEIFSEVCGAIDRIAASESLSDATVGLLKQVAECNTFVINKAVIPREQFLCKYLELLNAAMSDHHKRGQLLASALEVINLFEVGKISNPVIYFATVVYNLSILT